MKLAKGRESIPKSGRGGGGSAFEESSEQIITIESCPDTMSDQHQCWPDMI